MFYIIITGLLILTQASILILMIHQLQEILLNNLLIKECNKSSSLFT